jgi:pimeloyl-ACP methyl ester carboxylesterase
MHKGRNFWTLAGTAAGLAVGIAAERSIVRRRRRDDPEGGEDFGLRRGVRPRTIELSDGARIFIEEAGPESRAAAVFIHGSALRTDAWHYQIRGIDSHRLVFYDLRGHGLSTPKGESEYSIRTLSDDLGAVIENAGLDEVVLVGHSVGGMIALEYCVMHTSELGTRVKGVVLLNTTYGPAAETLAGGAAVSRLERVTRHPFDYLGSHAASIERLRKVIKPSDAVFWTVAMAAFGPGASARQIDLTYDMLAETPSDVIFDLVRSYRHFDVRGRLDEVIVPALVIGGTHDRLTVGKASQFLADNLPKAELKLLDGCGHMSMLERHGEVNRLLDAWLDDVLGGTQHG